ncbi:tumor necrosis factor receptor superfamily member 10B-like isoform X2 [Betta splendens]|uniref:Tumor necrosis factor receptor superfamily member 10B-like isoform X2 n=1 Tax=Betta splendens TaxID=158456 RepID=A0A6P7L4H0_BETSP|nr:tumor necrosis factor receptor superfamily member 10B-like isoform X2 [Betta splendens]
MSNLLLYEIVFVLILCGSTEAFLHSYPHVRASRVQRNVDCSTDQYLDGSICCTNCPAGTHVKSRCTTAGQRGTCQECQDGKYTAHANGLRQCLKCTVCRSDQETVTQCTTIQDTLCQCRPGTFCTPDQACELCRTCSTCKRDEEAVRNCTSTSNTQCKKIQANPDSNSANNYGLMVALVLIFTAVVALIIIIIIGVNCYKKRCHQTDARGHLQDEMKAAQNSNEDMRNGETQRSSFPSWEDEQFLKLTPVNGQESLRQCFGYFEELDIDYHKRFFRNLGIKDNIIKSKDHLQYEDKIHELLNIWLENVGRDGSLSDLLRVLLDLNLKRTAEVFMENAIHDNHYTCEC